MADFCLICECEPINIEDVYVNNKEAALVCRWCVEELINLKVHKKRCFQDGCYCIGVDFEK